MPAAITIDASVSPSSPVRSDVGVLFDLDGVIVDSRVFHMQAWERWAAVHAIDYAPGYFHEMFGRRNDAIIDGLRPGISGEELGRLADDKETLFREVARGQLEALPGVGELLEFLQSQDIARAIVTSTPRTNLDMILDDLGFADRFQSLVAEEDTSQGKPHPEGFLTGADRIGVEPTRCIVIEDAPAGLRAAKAGGMRAIGVTTTHAASALFEADLVVDTLDDAAVRSFIA